jgi:branched-chain amino acid transport system substrate-binding protein
MRSFALKFSTIALVCAVCAVSWQPIGFGSARNVALAAGGTQTIGVVEHLTGPSAYYGTGEVQAMRAATAYFNSTGGILGKQIQLQVVDDADNPAQSVTVVRKLASDSSIPIIMGPTNAPSDEADAPVAASLHIPLIANTGGVTCMKGGWGWTTFLPYFQIAKVVLTAYFKKTHQTRVALLTQNNNIAFTGLIPYIQRDLKQLGVKLVANVAYPQGTVDFSSEVSTIKAANPQAVLLDMIDVDAARFMVQARSAGLTTPWVVPNNSEATSTLKSVAGGAAIGMVTAALLNPNSKTSAYRAYNKWILKLYHKSLDPTTINGWDSMILMRDVIKKAKAFNRAKIENAIVHTKKFSGAAGKYVQHSCGEYWQQKVGVAKLTTQGYVPWP